MSAESSSDVDRVLDEVRSVFADLHGGRAVTVAPESDLAGELGLDSLAIVELHDRLEGAFAVRLSEDVLATARTPGDWLRAVLRARGETVIPGHRPAAPTTARPAGQAWPHGAETLTEALAWHVHAHPDLVTIRILGSHGPAEELSYRDLAHEAKAFARGLLALGLGAGERAAIMLPTGRDYFVAFVGALLAGGVPVPVYPPVNPSQLEEHLGRQAPLLASAGTSILVAGCDICEAERTLSPLVPSLRTGCTPATVTGGGARAHRLPAVGADDIALIQYTSGSTSDPKGVVLTHAQVLANVRALGQAVDVSTDDVFVSWLPLYHDMGLIGAWLTSLFFGFPLVVMAPLQFLARPVSWLEAISAHGGTLSAGPNFAYQSCVDRIGDEELEGIDLSSWRVAVNGSEPVHASTIERFVGRFGRYGFRRRAMCPAYGLAEMGLGLTLTPSGRGPRVDILERGPLQQAGEVVRAAAGDEEALTVVGCGEVVPGCQVRVTDGAGNALPDLREGAIQCQGPSATAGYFGNDAASRALWSEGWLCTGDLGYLRDGELFLTGRAKDMIIRGGRNLHPEDLERAIGEIGGVRDDGVAVFASSDPGHGTERLVVVVETDLGDPRARDELGTLVRRTAAGVIGAAPDEVVLVPAGSILRTAGLKIRRSATREAYEAGLLTPGDSPSAVRPAGLTRRRRRGPGRGLAGEAGSWLFGAYVWSLLVLLGVPLWVAVQLPLGPRLRWELTRGAGRALQVLAGIDLQVEGTFPVDRPGVVVANHSSFVDALAIVLALPGTMVFVTSTDMGRVRLIGSFLRRLGCVFVHRGEADRSAEDVQEMTALIRAGHQLVIFPEGSIAPTTGLRPFHLGAFAVAATAGCPVIPVGIRGTEDIVRPGTSLPHRSAATITIGSPIIPTAEGFAAEIELSDRVRRAVAALSGRIECDR